MSWEYQMLIQFTTLSPGSWFQIIPICADKYSPGYVDRIQGWHDLATFKQKLERTKVITFVLSRKLKRVSYLGKRDKDRFPIPLIAAKDLKECYEYQLETDTIMLKIYQSQKRADGNQAYETWSQFYLGHCGVPRYIKTAFHAYDGEQSSNYELFTLVADRDKFGIV